MSITDKIPPSPMELPVGKKYDFGKLRWDLLPVKETEAIVKVLTFGAEKYADNSWQNLPNRRERYYGALMRHLVAWRKGEIYDPESTLPHLYHVACNALFLIYDMHKSDPEKFGY